MDKRVLAIKTVEDMFEVLASKGHPLAHFKKGTKVNVWNKMEKRYSYTLAENPGENFAPGFEPVLSPGEMLAMGVFGGKYLNDCLLEFPAEWFLNAGMLGKLCPDKQDVSVNYFGVDSRLPLTSWQESGWVPGGPGFKGKSARGTLGDRAFNPDERGWFQWYCRYWMGRRLPELDSIQIQRWKSFARHRGAVEKACKRDDLECRPRQRQALIQWGWRFD